MRKGDGTLVRLVNTRVTVRALRAGGVPTLTGLARATGLSRQTVEAVLEELIARGLAAEAAPSEGAPGRPARRFRFRAEAGHVLGLDVGAHQALALLTDLDGTVVATERAPVSPDAPAADRLAALRAVAESCLGAAGIVRTTLLAVAAGTSGVVDRTGRVTLAGSLPGWTGLDLAGSVGRWFGRPGLAGNDANLAAVAEHWRGAARHASDVVYVLAGRRLGSALLIGGRPHLGRTGAAAEIGALRLLGWQDAAEEVTDTEVFAAAGRGEPAALRAVDRYARMVAQGASALVLAIDPELVVVGGGFAASGEVLLAPLREHLAKLCLNAPEVVGSALGEEVVALGAARIALDRVEADIDALTPP
ncbi:ROK family protein [Spongiactinospora sp. TRM90649]|uniref:ROK family protein n=1 Tax=Spongiactinospora sp. TRM90649 TaxID=3031114 RepID=UPI0023F6689C|nr:ROK family protein [Spongiactinospora sp. TRM90649]MDF5752680.1 ROK family protein [Spongiactinospora sp. TRM90649]